MAMKLRASVESRLDKFGGELSFSNGTDFRNYVAPHVRRENDALQGRLAADALQPPKVTGIRPPPAFVRDPMEVDDPSKLYLALVPEMRVRYLLCEVEMAYTIAKNAETFFRTSASSITVSLNPGVSIKTTGLLSTRNCGETCISEVQEWSPFPTWNASLFVARFTN